MKNRMNKLAGKMNSMMICAHAALTDRRGEGYVDTAVKILMAVVIGALVLAGLYALFGDVVMPTLTERIQEMFDYAGYPLTRRSSSPATRHRSNTTRKKSTPIRIGQWSASMRMRASPAPRPKSAKISSK